MTRLALLGVLSSALVLFVVIPAGSQNNSEELWRHRVLGRALYETPTNVADAPAELKKALDLAPNSFRDRLNYGLALLRAGNLNQAIDQLERAQKQNGSVPHTWFNLGIAYKRAGRTEAAVREFERMAKLVPDEPVTHYNLGLLYELQRRTAEALREFEKAADLDRDFAAPRFRLYNHYRLSGDSVAAEKALAEFQAAKARQDSGEIAVEDVEWSPYSELYDPVQALPALRSATTPPRLLFEDRKLAALLDSRTAGLVAFDADRDGAPDLLGWSRSGLRLYAAGKEAVSDSGLDAIADVIGAAPGDFDNDGIPDLCVLTESGARLFRNSGGKFVDSGVKLPPGRFRKALWLDFDHDYDLDLFLFGDRSVLMRNQGGGAFEDYSSHFPFASGRALDAVAFRVMPDSKSIDIAVSYAEGAGVLYRDRLVSRFTAEPLKAVPPQSAGLRALDVDNDGWIDIACSTPSGISLALNRQGKFIGQTVGPKGSYIFADLENRGFADLIAAGQVFRSRGLARFSGPMRPEGFAEFAALAQADFDGDGRTDLAAVNPDGNLHVLLNRTSTRNSWLGVTLNGVKNVKSGAGAEVEIRAGDFYQKAPYDGVPVLFGLGGHARVDTVRITWPNGLIQNETNQPVRRTLQVKEAPRLAGSCPMIFTWNGSRYQFITDVLGVAPLGASSSDDQYFPVDHDEYVSIAGAALAPVKGHYPIRITEELHEVSYLDQTQLIAVDHPRDTEIFTNEKFKSPPFPEFRLFGVNRRVHPISARDGAGRDLLSSVLRTDAAYAAGFAHESNGTAEMHSLILDFGAGPGDSAALFLNGWVDWADGSTFLNASERPGGGLVFPYLQVKDGAGNWKTVVEDMGIPSGKPKTMVVDLSGKFLSPSREVRIVTNLCVYWDEIFLGEHVANPKVRLTPLSADSAVLRLRGFSETVIDPRREQPETFEYARWSYDARWNQIPGTYTRYGDVRDLTLAADDRFVIMGSGDELQLSFPGSALPALPPGWRRDFLLLVDGWAKDSDANTAYSQTVEPLPFHAMSRYPYPASEHYPDDELHRTYRRLYNTRPAASFVPPLIALRPPAQVAR